MSIAQKVPLWTFSTFFQFFSKTRNIKVGPFTLDSHIFWEIFLKGGWPHLFPQKTKSWPFFGYEWRPWLLASLGSANASISSIILQSIYPRRRWGCSLGALDLTFGWRSNALNSSDIEMKGKREQEKGNGHGLLNTLQPVWSFFQSDECKKSQTMALGKEFERAKKRIR